MHRACLGLGSNVAPAEHLAAAVRRLRLLVSVVAVSTAWQSPAVGVEASDYVNAAVLVETTLPKHELIALFKRVEYELGRSRMFDSAHVPIDIDMLAFDGTLQSSDLWDLAYRAVPVAELLPDLASPVTGERLSEAASRLSAGTPIRPRHDVFRTEARALFATAHEDSAS
jgi:2-amino-4-hydroxy-6-hydroxymethyldihydropteridine diphosphokinase